ncbi:MAG TPA: DUF1552 domain-containing protein [Polyangiaceae bacterium]
MKRPRHSPTGFSRRQLLKTLGAGAALSPFLPLLNATGQEGGGTFPKRLLLFFSPDGTASIDDGGALVQWQPQGTETEFELQATHEPLKAIQSKIVVPYGLKMSAGGAGQEHAFGMAGLWTAASLHEPHDGFSFDGGNGLRTGWGSGASVDQYLATQFGPELPYQRALDDADPETPYRTLELGAQCEDPHSMHRMIYKGDKEPIHPEVNPKAAYDRLFANLDVDGSGASTPDPRLALKQSSLDILVADIERLRTRVGSEDYRKVDAHLEGLRAIERRLETTDPVASAGCTKPDVPPESTSRWENSAAFPGEAMAMMDLAVHALACDLTRIASVQLSRGFSNIVHEWSGHTQGHHTISHLSGDHTEELLQIDQWYAAQFAYLVKKLDSVVEGDGTMLDNTLVVWGREMGQTNHRMQPVNLILAGGARGGLSTGRYLSFNNEPHAKLLVSICRLMGADIASFGNRDKDSGPLAGV